MNLNVMDEFPSTDVLLEQSHLPAPRKLMGKERDDAILAQLKRIQKDTQVIGTEQRTQVWQNGWNEILQNFIASGYDLESLRPQWIKENAPFRLHREFYVSDIPLFEYEFQHEIKKAVFQRYFADVSNIYEFGCGTGYNLVRLAQMFPEKRLYGLDFVPAVPELLQLIAEKHGFPIETRLFNVKQPDTEYTLQPDSGICTLGCLEQVSDEFELFLQYLITQKPKICVHLEPIVELYDDENLNDWMAKQFHCKRRYLFGFYPRLQELESEGRIELIQVKRLEFGSLNHDSYTLLVWRPL